MKKGDAVLVTTQYRGVFFGYLAEYDDLPDEITLSTARNAVYWSSTTKGFMGLAANGPDDDCKIGPATDITLWGITSISLVSPAAVKRFEAVPWKS